jgi:selenocysteine lyase/cysteine desulfurase
MVPIDFAAMGCDSYATSGHKWVGAPRETGVLLVKYRRQDDVKSVMVGAYSAGLETLPGQLDYYPGAMRFEYGTRDVPRIMGMAEAMRVQEVMARDRIAEHGRALVAHLREGLEKISSIEVLSPRHPELGTSMLSFRTPRLGYREMFSTLVSDYGLRCRPVSEQGLDAVRVSCHIFNTVDDIDHLIHAIEKTVASAA